MPNLIYQTIPNPEDVLRLEPEELAGVVLAFLHSQPEERLNRYSFGLVNTVQDYPREYWERVSKALMEAWIWLEREGLIAPKPGEQGDWVFITRRGQRLKNATDLKAYRHSDLLPKKLLHPVLASKVHSSFIHGDYDTAVFQSFKEVEVAVRNAGKFTLSDLGADLIDKAFHKTTGPLTDSKVPESEREALRFLFRGAIGLYKNPHSHRNVTITDPTEAVEMIMLASHLLRIVDVRSAQMQAQKTTP